MKLTAVISRDISIKHRGLTHQTAGCNNYCVLGIVRVTPQRSMSEEYEWKARHEDTRGTPKLFYS